MIKRKYDIELFDEITRNHIQEAVNETEYPQHILNVMADGQTDISLKRMTKSIKFDDLWIKVIENYVPSLVRITKNLKSTLRYDAEIIPIEKTKRVDVESIKHLLANTQYIQDINENDEVLPQKLLSNLSEVEYGIYENRLIASLIQRLKRFVEHRIQAMRNHLESISRGEFAASSTFLFGDTHYKVSLNITEENETFDNDTLAYNLGVIEHAVDLDKHINSLMNTQFVNIMKRYRPITPPIMKTQIILKNPDYRNGYLLWLFLDKNNHFELDVNSNPTDNIIKSKYRTEIEQQLLLLFTMHMVNEPTEYQSKPVMIDDVTPKNVLAFSQNDMMSSETNDEKIIQYLEQLIDLEDNNSLVEVSKTPYFEIDIENQIDKVIDRTDTHDTQSDSTEASLPNDIKFESDDVEAVKLELNETLNQIKKTDQEAANQLNQMAIESQISSLNLDEINQKMVNLALIADHIGLMYEQAIQLEQKVLKEYKAASLKLIQTAKENAKAQIEQKLSELETDYELRCKDALRIVNARYKQEMDAIRKQLKAQKKRTDDQVTQNERALNQKERLRMYNKQRELNDKKDVLIERKKLSNEEKIQAQKNVVNDMKLTKKVGK